MLAILFQEKTKKNAEKNASIIEKGLGGRGLSAIAQKLEDKEVLSYRILNERLGTRPKAAPKMLCLAKGEL